MKYLKKFASVALALVMMMALAAPAFAAEDDPVITITNPNGHVFTAYQIFVGELADNSSLKGETITWGPYVTDAGKTAIIEALKTAFPGDTDAGEESIFKDCTADKPADLATILSKNFTEQGKYSNATARTKLANAIGGTITANPPSISQKVPMTNGVGTVKPGWCLITEQLNDEDNNPTFMLEQVTVSESVSRKTQDETVTKEVWDPKIDTDGGWSDGAIYPISDDEIKFQLTVALPDNLLEKYKNADPKQAYKITLHDVQSEALTDTTITKVTLYGKSGNEIAKLNQGTDYFFTEGKHDATETRPACTFEVTIPNVQDLTNVEDSGKIVVEYTAKLNDAAKAKTGLDGNLNHVELWVNDEDTDSWSEVKVFALEIKIDKVDGDGNPLTGAEFTLYKEDEWDTDKNEPKKDSEGNALPGTPLNASTSDEKVTVGEGENEKEINWIAGSKFSLKGLEPGTYYLTEKAPGSYNAIKPIKLVIDASTTETSGPEAGVLNVTITDDQDQFNKEDGNAFATIKNVIGTLLPETGGIGTTIFYIVGGVLVLGAVVLLISKRRASADDE